MAKLGEMLLSEGLITKEQIDRALAAQQKDGGFLGAILIHQKVLSEKQLVDVLVRQTGTPAVDLETIDFPAVLADLLPANMARKYQCVPVKENGNMLHVAMANPEDDRAIDAIAFKTGRTIKRLVAGPQSIEKAWGKLYPKGAVEELSQSQMRGKSDAANGKAELKELDKFISGAVDTVEVVDQKKDDAGPHNLDMGASDPPIIKLINGLLMKAVSMRASDIHVEPFEKELRVRLRVDGVLHKILELPPQFRHSVGSRIKIMAGLDIAERRIPQDGRVKVLLEKKTPIDFRVSVLPGVYGEKVVIRVLGQGSLKAGVHELPFNKHAMQDVQDSLRNPYGMILVTGPTGSGKSTTLYTMLTQLNQMDVNIVTAEDPVEYNLPGITQVNVRPGIGFTFDMALRSFLRQDPDIIMVGEMRDYETAAIAVKAALTGHLVLSTLHTNDSPSTIVRLVDMGIEPYLVASAVKVVIAQRLVRKICPDCRAETQLSDGDRTNLSESEVASISTLYAGKGCETCSAIGYLGRMPVFEVLTVKSKEIKRVITEGGTEIQVAHVARKEGMRTLKDEVLDMVNRGETTLEEAFSIIMSD